MSRESGSDRGGEAAVAPGNPVVARRVPGKVRRMPRACAPEGCDGYYHVVSRINGRARLLTDTRREGFRELLGRVADFCGVEVLTYCFMENHFHLLVRVPGELGEIDDEELLRRSALLYGAPPSRGRQPLSLAGIRGALERGTAEEREAMRALLLGRMGSLPMFVKILKQRFSLRYNREHGRLGTLWEGPFRSVLVEPTRRALSVVGAYIDLNPVRAGIVEDPKDYRFSGYGEAVGQGKPEGHVLLRRLVLLGSGVQGSDAGGGKGEGAVCAAVDTNDVSAAEARGSGGAADGSGADERAGVAGVAVGHPGLRKDGKEAAGDDAGSGDVRARRDPAPERDRATGERGQVPRSGGTTNERSCSLSSGSRGQECPLSVGDLREEAWEYRKLLYGEGARTRRGGGAVVELEKAWAVERAGGKLSLAQLLRCRVRYLTDGAVIGGKAWMEDWLRANKETYGKRKTPPRPMRGGVWDGLCSLRDLKKDVFG